jgi:glycosyltransferase involved in cell wall biosynthesis
VHVCIVTVAAHGIGGMQDHTRDLARGLVAAGHDVDVIAGHHPDGIESETRHGARWWYLPYSPKRTRLPRRNPDWLRATYEKFTELHRAAPFDIVHSESTSAIELVRRGVPREVPLVATFHGNVISLVRAAVQRARRGDGHAKAREAKHLVWLGLEHFQFGHWYRFRPFEWMAVSEQQFEDTRKGLFLDATRGHVVPNGIDTSIFRPRDRDEVRAELGLPPAPLVVGVGRLNAEKSFDVALRALAGLDPALGAQLVVVGDGEEREALARLTSELGLEERAHFVGPKPAEAVAAYMAASDVFVFPTQRDEAQGMVLPQAMASGAAVIASSIGAIPEIVQEPGRNGILVPPGDVAALTRELELLLRDDALRARLGAAARLRAEEEYTLERMVERTLAVYELAIRRQAGGGSTS